MQFLRVLLPCRHSLTFIEYRFPCDSVNFTPAAEKNVLMNGCFLERAVERNLGQPRPLIPPPPFPEPSPLLFPSLKPKQHTKFKDPEHCNTTTTNNNITIIDTTQAQKFREKETHKVIVIIAIIIVIALCRGFP